MFTQVRHALLQKFFSATLRAVAVPLSYCGYLNEREGVENRYSPGVFSSLRLTSTGMVLA